MKLTPQQDAAAKAIKVWLSSNNQQVFVLGGYAGTGKTFLLGCIIGDINRTVHCCAPTGKAASVLRSKLDGVDVTTIHRLLYLPESADPTRFHQLSAQLEIARNNPAVSPDELDQLTAQLKDEAAKLSKVRFTVNSEHAITPNDLVVVDEASMVSPWVLDDLKATRAKILLVGDPSQLPPVNAPDLFETFPPDSFLTDIQRQALDSPIIRLSKHIREGSGAVTARDCEGACAMEPKEAVAPEQWAAADQVITGSNGSRMRINRYFRKVLGRSCSQLPLTGDKMICLKNDYNAWPMRINGVQFTCEADTRQEDNPVITAKYEGVFIPDVPFYPFHCQRNYDRDLVEAPRDLRAGLLECDYAYAITVHKSQGSEWDFVLIADDGMWTDRKEYRRRWLYTAVTRAKQKLLIVH